MEETKGRKEAAERAEREAVEKKNGGGGSDMKAGDDPMAEAAKAKEVIREAIVAKSTGETENRAQQPDDILAFSRSVHKVDSSLE